MSQGASGFSDLLPSLTAAMPQLRGRLLANEVALRLR